MLVLLDDDEEVHRPRLGDIPVEQPEHLVVALELRELLRLQRRCVVQRELVSSRAARPRAHNVAVREQGDLACAASPEVGACGRADHVEHGMVRCGDAEVCSERVR